MSDQILLQHILSQTQANVSFLASQGYIPPADATDIITRLATAQTKKATTPDQLANSVRSLAVTPIAPTPAPVAEPVRRTVPAPPPRVQKAKALWAYNEEGTVRLSIIFLTTLIS